MRLRPSGVAESRFRRVATLALWVTIVATGVVDLTAILHQSPYFAGWWWWPAVVLNLGIVVAFLVLPFVAARFLPLAAGIYAIGSLIVLITSPLAGHLPDEDLGSAWPLRIISSFGVAAALAFRTRTVWVYMGALAVVSFIAASFDAGDARVGLETTLVNLSVSVPLSLVALAVMNTGRALDAAAASAIDAARRDAAGAAAALERRRVELLAHDDILYTLRATALGFDTAALARASLDRLEQVDGPAVADVVTRLRSITSQLAPTGSFSAEGSAVLEPEIADALVQAAGEALRNSIVHAPGAALRVSVDLGPDRAQVSIIDDGPGFRPSRLPTGRLGVSRSIVDRMQSVPGGSARILSAPGRGTTVELGWAA